jgi:hypothetical protein
VAVGVVMMAILEVEKAVTRRLGRRVAPQASGGKASA